MVSRRLRENLDNKAEYWNTPVIQEIRDACASNTDTP
jgi:hypothetical protein